MADDKPTETPAPAAESATSSPAETSSPGQPASAPTAEAAPARIDADAPVAEVTARSVADTPSLLDEAKGVEPPKVEEKKPEAEEPKTEEKPVDAKPAEEKPTETKAEEKPKEGETSEAKPEETAAEAPKLEAVDYKYELPEGITLDDEGRKEFASVLDGLRADPGNVQPLIDYHVKHVNQIVATIGQQQHDTFNTTRAGWRNDLKADEEFGGNAYETSFKAAVRMRDLLVSDHKPGTPERAADEKAFTEFCRVTGAGDHPQLWKMLLRASRYFDEPKMPPPNPMPAPNGRAPGNRRSTLYDNPTSPNNRS